eukprot:TRINITY_DN7156_c0_g1_i1.p1 TRINITY_DN7156_c0_g1~~TRINITY_DN7156_c0_g1_i1.p1  ORF type:complete len:314 (+),score=52.59 TRINITY_DN7156_c0_g1_i1:108-1049(+)
MYNPYFYRTAPTAAEQEQAEQKHQAARKAIRERLAGASRERQAEEQPLVAASAGYLAAPLRRLSRSAASLPDTSPWRGPAEHSFRDRDPTRDVSPDKPFRPQKWRYSPEKERIPHTVEANLQACTYVTQPKYADPGMNTRNGGFSYNTVTYTLRARERGKEVSTEPFRLGGWRSEQERVLWAAEKFGPVKLEPLMDDTVGSSGSVASIAASAPRPPADPSKWVSPHRDFVRHHRRLSQFSDPNRDAEGKVRDPKDRPTEPFVENVHVSTSLPSATFRTRDKKKELPAIEKNVPPFSPIVKSGKPFERMNYCPL